MNKTSVIDGTASPVRQLNLGGVLRIPAVRQVLLLIGVAASVAAGFAVVLWSQTPTYTELYGKLESADMAAVAGALRAAGIDFELNTVSGSLSVPESRLHDARLELASRGLPQGTSSGMEMLGDQSSFGVSQFMENARYQHALEAELARTISHLGAVEDARVHLALPRQSAFIRDERQASASVLLQLYRGRTLERDQVSAIVHLVASSVPNLDAGNVTLIDQNGTLLRAAGEQSSGLEAGDSFERARKLEAIYRQRIEDLLTPLVGPGRVRAQVVADLDFTVTERTEESFDPARSAVRSEQINVERTRPGESPAAGIPGALSNQPPQASAPAAADGEAVAAGPQPVNTTESSTRNFEVDRTISHTRPESGSIERLSIAVLVDDSAPAGEAEADHAPLSEADIQRYTALVKEAVGFDAARGDSVVVVNAAFRAVPEPASVDGPAFWEKPLVMDTLKQVLGAALVLALGFGLVRPMLRNLLANNSMSSTEYIASGGMMVPVAAQLPGSRGALGGPGFDEKVAAAKNITGHDPARVAQVVRKWVTVDD
jgi:flagellar M-ring protein FliF